VELLTAVVGAPGWMGGPPPLPSPRTACVCYFFFSQPSKQTTRKQESREILRGVLSKTDGVKRREAGRGGEGEGEGRRVGLGG
jgi:hypothetical protein